MMNSVVNFVEFCQFWQFDNYTTCHGNYYQSPIQCIQSDSCTSFYVYPYSLQYNNVEACSRSIRIQFPSQQYFHAYKKYKWSYNWTESNYTTCHGNYYQSPIQCIQSDSCTSFYVYPYALQYNNVEACSRSIRIQFPSQQYFHAYKKYKWSYNWTESNYTTCHGNYYQSPIQCIQSDSCTSVYVYPYALQYNNVRSLQQEHPHPVSFIVVFPRLQKVQMVV